MGLITLLCKCRWNLRFLGKGTVVARVRVRVGPRPARNHDLTWAVNSQIYDPRGSGILLKAAHRILLPILVETSQHLLNVSRNVCKTHWLPTNTSDLSQCWQNSVKHSTQNTIFGVWHFNEFLQQFIRKSNFAEKLQNDANDCTFWLWSAAKVCTSCKSRKIFSMNI